MTRPSREQYFAKLAALVATRSTCLRRAVGCVLVNERGHVIATGYNGVAAGQPHCNELVPVHEYHEPNYDGVKLVKRTITSFPHACHGATAQSGTELDACEAIHAEQNALLQCRDVWAIADCYVTTLPCVTCTKLLLGTSCQRIYYGDDYAAGGAELWLRAGRSLLKM